MSAAFWEEIDRLCASATHVLDRPGGSPHPRFPEWVYPLAYGYLDGTKGGDGEGIDVWFGSADAERSTAIACTVDPYKRGRFSTSGCTGAEVEAVRAFYWIAGERMRDGKAQAQAALSRQGRYRAVQDSLRVKEVTLDDQSGVRWIVCHNPHEAERDAARRQDALTRLTSELERIKQARARDAQRRRAGKKAPADDVHVRAECALRDHTTLGRWLRQLPSGRLVLDRKKIAAEERLDGKYLLSTSDPDLSAEDVALGDKNLSRPNVASVTSRAPWTCDLCSTASSRGSGRTCCCAGWRCCSSASPSAAPG